MRISLVRHPLPWGGELNLHPEGEKISQERIHVSSRRPPARANQAKPPWGPTGNTHRKKPQRGPSASWTHPFSRQHHPTLCILAPESAPMVAFSLCLQQGVERKEETSPSLYYGETESPTGERTHPRSFQLELRTALNCSLNPEFSAHSWSKEGPFFLIRAGGDSGLAGATENKMRPRRSDPRGSSSYAVAWSDYDPCCY